jgi:hypothetical protein
MPVDLPDRHPAEPEIVDSGVHVRDSERGPATGAQMTLVAALVVVILSVFFYGLNSQRNETTAPATTASSGTSQQAQNVPPAKSQGKGNAKPQTTGAAPKTDAPNPKNPQGATRQQQPQKTNATPPQHNGGQNEAQPATAPKQNQ